jgi:DNA-binding response OmpR family regulator
MKGKILIVDDELENLKLVGLFLQSKGYSIAAAKNGSQGLEKAKQENPDAIILDVIMPDISGFEVCRLLRTEPETAAIPVMMLTAKNRVTDKVVGFEAGADEYVTKPILPEQLLERLEAMLERTSRKRKET